MAVTPNYVRARNKKTGVEIDLMPKAYEILKNQYELVSGQEYTEKKTQGKSAEAVAPERKILTPEEIAAKKAELKALNQEAIEKAEEERKKPGPKPKINA